MSQPLQAIFALVLLGAFALTQSPRAGADDLSALEAAAFRAAADRVADSVVQVQCVGGRRRVGGVALGDGPGTGLVVSPDGLILTSRFHFARRPNAILVTLPGGTRLPARLLGSDASRGLVLLKVDLPEGTPPLKVPAVADADTARPGAWALAIGRTFESTAVNVSVGVVSATDRMWGKAIQTDAKISPSNYGGPLVDIHGNVWGLLVPLSPNREGEVAGAAWYDSGIGFAIPYETIRKVLPRLAQGENLQGGFLGVSLVQEQNWFSLTPEIQVVHPDSPAEAAGLEVKDQILAVDRQPVATIAELMYRLKPHLAGDEVELLIRRDGEQLGKTVVLTAERKIPWRKTPGGPQARPVPGRPKKDRFDHL